MPFTFAHPAVVLPVKYLSRKWVSLTALVIGSIVPDFEYFIRFQVKSTFSHSWAGLFWFDLPLGVFLFFVYEKVVKRPLIDNLPNTLRERFIGFKTQDFNMAIERWLVWSCCILLGAASHLLWDAFTHQTGYFVVAIPMLSSSICFSKLCIPVYKAIQHISTIIGISIILFAVCRLPKVRTGKTTRPKKFWAVVLVTVAAILIYKVLINWRALHFGDIVVTTISGLLIGLIVASITIDTPQTDHQ